MKRGDTPTNTTQTTAQPWICSPLYRAGAAEAFAVQQVGRQDTGPHRIPAFASAQLRYPRPAAAVSALLLRAMPPLFRPGHMAAYFIFIALHQLQQMQT